MQFFGDYGYLIFALLGLCFGSFACATLWRQRARQLVEEKVRGEKVDGHEYKRLKQLSKVTILHDYSRCLSCSYRLKWYDMIPVFSWVFLKGKCRNCKKPIGLLEPLMEIGTMILFVSIFMFWPYQLNNPLEIARFVLWLVSAVILVILFVYDLLWYILPDRWNYLLAAVGLVNSAIIVLLSADKLAGVNNILFSVLILGGIYWVLNRVSDGRWIGYGDVKLGVGLGLMLADWRLSFIALFLANLVGSIIVIPLVLTGKLKRNSKVPFGPLLIIGFLLSAMFGMYIVNGLFYGLV